MDYEKQQVANLLSFYTDEEMNHRRNVLLRLIERMSKEEVYWALSCSCAFYFRGIVDEYHDYDVVVEKTSIDKFIAIFIEMGGTLTFGQHGKENYFDSKVYCFGELDGLEFDVISEFTITTYGTRYCYDLKRSHIEYVKDIPLCPVEANLILYGMMIPWQQKRRFKYEAAMRYLRANGVRYREILELTSEMPKFILDDIKHYKRNLPHPRFSTEIVGAWLY